ncbi:MAG: S1 RNA-binding domain-containing protein [Phycisphaerae bacterium]|jgi:small subunit ribosomal protein S1|nr:S1 RNA-binding domain-containing protein [Phycisphaerae bacterium]MBT6282228.1 S1 RNA-binding domain-containing protein [Phycisphaerae bacterium]
MAKNIPNDELNREILNAIGDGSFADMLDVQAQSTPTRRSARSGVVAAIHGRNVLVEFGPREQGCCPKSHFEELPQVGESLDFIVERTDSDGMLVLSRKGAVQKATWDALETGQVVEAKCSGTNKGGLEMEVAGHKAFMPAGQVAIHHLPDLDIMIGQKMACEVIELDRRANRIVLSRKKVLYAEREAAKEEMLETLNAGDTYDATITSVQPYGAFADIGGIEGLIHKSEMTWERDIDPSKFVKIGDIVKIQILDIDLTNEQPKIAFGMKQLIEDPFVSSMATIEVGETVTGTVTRLADFGAFVDLGSGTEGLVHISELADHRIKSPKDVVKEQQVITVKVLSVDPATRRIALSLKQAVGNYDGEDAPLREEDNAMRKLREKFGNGPLKGGIG